MMILRSFLVVAVCLAGFARAGEFPDSWTWDDDAAQRANHAALEGKPMPALELSHWVGTAVSSDSMKGKVVLIDFYATWCGPCMATVPHNNELLNKYKDRGLVVMGVCTSSHGQEKFEANAKEYKMEYPVAADPQLTNEKTWAVHYYPTLAVIDRQGTLRAIGLQPERVEEVVKKLLAEK